MTPAEATDDATLANTKANLSLAMPPPTTAKAHKAGTAASKKVKIDPATPDVNRAPSSAAQASAAPVQQLPQAFSWQCPGLHGPGSKTDVKRRALGDLLSDARRIVIPMIQRAYCWSTETTVPGWWTSTALGSSHSVGKAIYREVDGEFVCLDGQQRITTTALLVASGRDALVDLRLRADQEADAMALAAIDAGTRTLEQFLFMNVDAAHAWLASGQEHVAGQRLDFFRVLPSFADRSAFFELILRGTRRAASSQPVSEATERSKQYDTMRYFDARFAELAAEHDNLRDAADAVLARTESALAMQAMVIDVLTENAPVAAIYQWLQEKTLLSPGALLFNPTPGLSMHACDLVRNNLLASRMDESIEEQERFFEEQWTRRVELPAHGKPEIIDVALEKLLAQVRVPQPGAAEQQMRAMLRSPEFSAIKRNFSNLDFSGLLLYVRVLSLIEFVESRVRTQLGDLSDADIKKQAAQGIIDQLSAVIMETN